MIIRSLKGKEVVHDMNRIPLQGQIEITNICNFKCVHCYVTNSKNQKPCFLPYDVIQSVIDESCEMGCKIITITGGECTLHPDFEKIYTYIWKKGIKVNIFTNASLLTEATVSLFKKYMPNCVEVSLYGASESVYEEVTKSCSYADVINGIKLLQENGINVQIKIIVLKQNQYELEEMKRLACRYTSNPIRVSYDLMPSYDFSLDVLNNHSNAVSSASVKSSPRTNQRAFNCHAGSSFFCINYEGNVTLCSFCSFSAMNLKDYSFHYIWESFKKSANLSIPKDSECYDCSFLEECGNCPARTWMFNQKIGLYPIPQCKKIKNYEGGFSMQTSKKLLPESFVVINGITYFRLEEGQVAVEKTSKVTIKSSKDDSIELRTLNCDSREVRFWKVNDKIYALASSSCVTIPEETTFVACYSSDNYPEGQYVKYMSYGRCGIIYVSETEVSHVISYENGYTEICFENNLFYADSKEGDNKYHVTGESGKLLGTFPSKCRKLDGYMLFYDDNSIFINSSKFDIPGGVSSVEVIKQGKITFVKVVNGNGIYYYTKGIEYLFGPIQKDEIHDIDHKSCFVYEVVNKKVIQVFYIKIKKDAYECKALSSKKGIDCLLFNGEFNGKFFVADKALYVLQDEKFIPLISGVSADKYILHAKKVNWGQEWKVIIVGCQKNIPVYLAYYETGYKKVFDEGALERIADGYKSRDNKFYHICRKGKEIVLISPDGEVVLSVEGKNCYKKKYRNNYVYVVEKDEDIIELYWTDGKEV